jgi:hypothetical protein
MVYAVESIRPRKPAWDGIAISLRIESSVGRATGSVCAAAWRDAMKNSAHAIIPPWIHDIFGIAALWSDVTQPTRAGLRGGAPNLVSAFATGLC